MARILSLSDAARIATDVRGAGRKVVTTNGVFDLLSVPHLRLLEAAKASGDVLLVGINSDASVRALKGDKRPIVPEMQRAELVAGLGCVHGVFLFDEPDPREWLRAIKPDIHVNSSEYGEKCVEADVVRQIGARLVLVPREEGVLSTSDVIEMIRSRYCS